MSHIHLPDGILPWWLWLGGYLLAAGLLWLVWRWGRTADARRFALLGVFAALMILVMTLFEIPVFTYHINLSVVTAIVLGPGLGLLAACIVNLFLALFGHGGITVAGLNTLVFGVEMLAGYAVFRGLTRLRLPLVLAGFLAVVSGLGCGTAASYGIVAAAAPSINANIQRLEAHEAHGQAEAHADEHDVIARAAEGGRVNLTRLAYLMFGLGALGWLLEGLLSATLLAALRRLLPDLLTGER